jgi:cytochrome c oxidase subunit 2
MWKDFPLLPDSASTMANQIDMVWWFLVALTVVMTGLIAAAVVGMTIWFRKKNDGRYATQIVGSTQLEILWSGIPFLILMGLFGWGTAVFVNTQRTPDNVDIDMYVVGKQWMWKVQHPTGQREINAMHVPVGKVVRITQTSEDVIHSFFIPAFRMKKDAVPGRYSQQWFEATKVGTYHIFCAEYCGSKHAQMIGWVTVMEQEEYERWLASTTPSEVPEEAGRKLFEGMRCASCHVTTPGVSQIDGAAPRGPSMVDIYGREVALKDNRKIVVDDGYIRESILHPMAKVTAGFEPNMPTYEGQLGEDQILQLIAYIKSLKSTGTKQ